MNPVVLERQLLTWINNYGQPDQGIGVSYFWLSRQTIPTCGYPRKSELNRALAELRKAGLIKKSRARFKGPVVKEQCSFSHYHITPQGKETLTALSAS